MIWSIMQCVTCNKYALFTSKLILKKNKNKNPCEERKMFLNEKHSFIPIWKWGTSNIVMQIELNLIWIHI
jgi:hypothetical protein